MGQGGRAGSSHSEGPRGDRSPRDSPTLDASVDYPLISAGQRADNQKIASEIAMQKTTLFRQHLKAPETRTGRLIGGSVAKFLEDSKFFWTEYHLGKINIVMHLVSFSLLFYGLAEKSVPLVLIGLFVFDEMGHAYNYFVVHKRDPRFGLRMIPYQLFYATLIMPVLFKLFGWF
jgi:hypothetical protein